MISPEDQTPLELGKAQSGYVQTSPASDLFGWPNGDTPQSAGDIRMSLIRGDRIASQSGPGPVSPCRCPCPAATCCFNDKGDDRVLVIDPHTDQIVWLYGTTGPPGTGYHLLDILDVMDGG